MKSIQFSTAKNRVKIELQEGKDAMDKADIMHSTSNDWRWQKQEISPVLAAVMIKALKEYLKENIGRTYE